MCGIAGAFSKDGLRYNALVHATDVMAHRGPDSKGYYTDDANQVFLGHRRLSIIDLSNAATQPMYTADGRYVMVYNGELYNYIDLKAKLPNQDWKTHSDTEVIIELFAAFGPECFSWFNGMFAVAIYDIQEQKLHISRDQVGIKPIFYYWDEQTLVFGSELKVIKDYCTQAGIKLTTNKEAIPYFLHLGFIPEPLSIYNNVYKFPSAQYAELHVRSGELKFTTYWQAKDHFLTNPVTDETTATKKYKDIIYHAVQGQMIADVPLGTFLSGGIDSSLVTAVASKLSAQKVKTFSIGFNEAAFDESQYAADVAKHLDTEHHTFKVSVNDVLDLVPTLLDAYDEPFGDSSAFPTMLVSELARRHVTVTLSGDGGDEMFQGYGMYTWANRLDKPAVKAFHKPLYQLTQLGNARIKRGGQIFNYPSSSRLHTHIFSQEQYFFSEQELNKLLATPSFNFTKVNQTANPKGSTAAERQAFWDFENYLKDDLLVKVDRASMQYSLETRVPLLDINLIEFALNLDYSLKVKEGYGTKYLMKKVLYELVPRQLFERPKKGFSIPLKDWLLGPLSYMLDDYLNEHVVSEFGVVNNNEVQSLVKRFREGEGFLYNRIWVLVILHWWLKKNKI
ncbi:MAG: asparagine synthase (glutamine-hydrolyzing) [Sphingobacteriales bacterium]|nr:MAG: asparagine synthase (glutamine-hydrolyzing) [Sphingobacteriales bacterium]